MVTLLGNQHVAAAEGPRTPVLPSIGVLGAGAMGQSLLSGITKPGVSVRGTIHATCHSARGAAGLQRFQAVVADSVEENPEANRRAAKESEVVVLAVSPDQVPAVMQDVSCSLRPGAIVISLAAGVTLSRLTGLVAESVAVVRAMPNLGGKVGFGVTGIGTNDGCSDEDLRKAVNVLSTVGTVMTVRDDQMDALSAVSGSGPAYFYYFIEQLAAAAVELGFTQDQAQQLAEQTFLGSAALMHRTGEAPGELIAQLTHPKGTTFRAITEMSNGRLKELFVQAASASMSRAQQIAQETNA